MTRTNPRVIRALLKERGLSLQKQFGQNFLIDANIAEAIIEQMQLSERDIVLEIGPGIGALTERILPRVEKLIAVEIDRRLAEHLERDFPEPKLSVIPQDVLKMDLSILPSGVKIVGNLPYYITSAILMLFLESSLDFSSLTLMMQREVAERLAAGPGTKDYGVLSVITQLYSQVELAFRVSRHCFMPEPKVESAVVHLKPCRTPMPPGTIPLIKAAFSSRRKTLLNNLTHHYGKEKALRMLSQTGIPEGVRAEMLTPEDFLRLAQV